MIEFLKTNEYTAIHQPLYCHGIVFYPNFAYFHPD